MNDDQGPASLNLPGGVERLTVSATIAAAGPHAVKRFVEFFAATIRNRNTVVSPSPLDNTECCCSTKPDRLGSGSSGAARAATAASPDVVRRRRDGDGGAHATCYVLGGAVGRAATPRRGPAGAASRLLAAGRTPVTSAAAWCCSARSSVRSHAARRPASRSGAARHTPA